MSTLNLNANINGAKRGLPYPTAGLDVIVYNSTYEDGGTTYYRTSKGIGLPVISGTGLDTIIDFSPLSDVRFDKGSYVGNAFGLPEYYNFPYVGIYYDATSKATRYHWKITDFGYAAIESQAVNLTNWAFLKAKATTNTSNVIASWSQLLIYSTDYIETTCISAGTAYKANTTAYGLVFDAIFYKNGSQPIYQFISDNNTDYTTNSGYLISLYGKRISMYKVTNGSLSSLFRTVVDYVSDSTNYRLLIFRNQTENQYVTGGIGTFAVYIQGKNKAITETVYTEPNTNEMELVDTTGGTGSNPVTDNTYTTSAYKVADLGKGDKLSIEGETFDTWTQGTGKYAHYNNGEQTGIALTRLKNYIGIQADFYGENLISNPDFIDIDEDGLGDDWTASYTNNSIENNILKCAAIDGTSYYYQQRLHTDAGFEPDNNYLVEFYFQTNGSNWGNSNFRFIQGTGGNRKIYIFQSSTEMTKILMDITAYDVSLYTYFGIEPNSILGEDGDWYKIYKPSVKKLCVNYYSK